MIPSVLSLKTSGIAAAVALAAGGLAGWKLHDRLVHQPHLAADARAAERIAAAGQQLSAEAIRAGLALRDRADARQADIRASTDTILREVPRYVSSTVKCPAAVPAGAITPASRAPDRAVLADVSVGFGVLWNAAATGSDPGAAAVPGVDLDAPAQVGMPEVARAAVSNFGACRAAFAENLDWREYAVTLTAWRERANAELAKAARR